MQLFQVHEMVEEICNIWSICLNLYSTFILFTSLINPRAVVYKETYEQFFFLDIFLGVLTFTFTKVKAPIVV